MQMCLKRDFPFVIFLGTRTNGFFLFYVMSKLTRNLVTEISGDFVPGNRKTQGEKTTPRSVKTCSQKVLVTSSIYKMLMKSCFLRDFGLAKLLSTRTNEWSLFKLLSKSAEKPVLRVFQLEK